MNTVMDFFSGGQARLFRKGKDDTPAKVKKKDTFNPDEERRKLAAAKTKIGTGSAALAEETLGGAATLG